MTRQMRPAAGESLGGPALRPDDPARPEPACRFAIPRPPSTNNLYANVPGKGRVKTKRYRAWIDEAGWTVKAALQPMPHFAGEVEIEIAGLGKLDVDNTKAIPDLLKTLGILDDDKQIARQMTGRFAPSWFTLDRSVLVSIWPI